MATESMSRQIHTAAEQTEMAARRGMTSVEEAADLETARLRLDLASSEAQRSMLERHLAAAREELDSKQSLAGKCIYLSVSFTFEVQVSSRIVARVYVFNCTELEPNGRLLHCVTACQFICSLITCLNLCCALSRAALQSASFASSRGLFRWVPRPHRRKRNSSSALSSQPPSHVASALSSSVPFELQKLSRPGSDAHMPFARALWRISARLCQKCKTVPLLILCCN